MPSGLPRHGHPAAHPAVGPFVFDAFATSTGSRFHSFDSWHRWELEMRNPKCRHAPSNDQSFSMMATLPRLSMKPWLGFCPFLELCWSLPMSSLLITQNFLTSQYIMYIIYPQNFGNTCLFQDLPIGWLGRTWWPPKWLVLTILSP